MTSIPPEGASPAITTTHDFKKRRNTLTESDLNIIRQTVESALTQKVEEVKRLHAAEECRFATITLDDMEEAVKFYRSVNKILDESKTTVRKTVLVFVIGSIFTILGLGVVFKIKDIAGN